MDEQLEAVVVLGLGDVVSDVVDLARPARGGWAEHAPDRLAYRVGDHVPVGEGEVGGGRHRGEVCAPLGAGGGRAGELAVGQDDPVAALDGVHDADVVGADLMPEPS